MTITADHGMKAAKANALGTSISGVAVRESAGGEAGTTAGCHAASSGSARVGSILKDSFLLFSLYSINILYIYTVASGDTRTPVEPGEPGGEVGRTLPGTCI